MTKGMIIIPKIALTILNCKQSAMMPHKNQDRSKNRKDEMRILVDTDGPTQGTAASILFSLLESREFSSRVAAVFFQESSSAKTFVSLDHEGIPIIRTQKDRDGYFDSLKLGRLIKSPISFHNKITAVFLRCRRRLLCLLPYRYWQYIRLQKKFYFNTIVHILHRPQQLVSMSKRRGRFRHLFLLLDPIGPSPLYQEPYKSSLAKRERKAIRLSVAYFVPQGWLKQYSALYPGYRLQTFYFPLLKKSLFQDEPPQTMPKEDFLYLGAIHEHRESEILLSFLEFSQKTLFVYGEAKTSQRIVRRPRVPAEELPHLVQAFRFLVVLDNSGPRSDYLPSKAITYVSTGKPIIVFGAGNTATERFLQSYPLHFYCKGISDFQTLLCFISAAKGKQVPWQTIIEAYSFNTPETVANELLRSIDLVSK